MSLSDPSKILLEPELERLREGYDGDALLQAGVDGMSRLYPPFQPWAEGVARSFYRAEPLSPRDRELCLIGLLTTRSPGLNLARHVYAGMMEGLSVDQICHAIGLAGCYHGMPMAIEGALVVNRTLRLLKRLLADGSNCTSPAVLSAMVKEFENERL